MNKPDTADQYRARVEAAHAAASTATGGNFIRQKDGTLVPDPAYVSTDAPALDVPASAAPALVAATEALDLSGQSGAKKPR
jgi:hypothetical protein